MPNTIKIKNSAVAAKVPAISDLDYGEIALNYADGIIFYKRADNTVQSISGSGGGDVTTTGTQTLTNKTIAYSSNTLTGVQPQLVSGTTIKTINSTSLLGSGDITISGGGASALTIDNKTGAYTVVAGDLGKIINCTSGTFTVSLTAAATLGAGFNCTIWNTSITASDTITIDPAGTETLDGLTTLILCRGEGMQVICDGTKWQTGDKKTMRLYAENYPATSARPISSADFSVAIGYGAEATGVGSYAFGGIASGNNSMSLGAYFGTRATASSQYSFAAGLNSSGSGSQAVTGSGAMAFGGSYASGTDSFAAAVGNNSSSYGARGASSIAVGQTANASGAEANAFGRLCSATGGSGATAVGAVATASGSGSVCIGNSNVASGNFSHSYGTDIQSLQYGKYSYGAGKFTGVGDAQSGMFVLRRATTNATATVLTTDNTAPGTNDQVILPNNSAYAFTGTIVARQQAAGGTQTAAWRVEGLIRREGTAASTTLVNSALTVISNTPGWNIALSADTTNGGLAVTATGAAATNIRWVATLQTSEVTYA